MQRTRQRKKKRTLLSPWLLVLAAVSFTGCGGDAASGNEASQALVLSEVVTLTQGPDINARPEIFFHDGMFFIVYLNRDLTGRNQHRVRIYDAGLSAVLAEYTLSTTTSQYGLPTDIRGRQDGGKVYLAYGSVKALPSGDKESYLFIAAHNLNVTFSRATPTENANVLLASSFGSGPGAELFNDPTVHVKDGMLFLLTHIVTGPTGANIHYLRKYNLSAFDAKNPEGEGVVNLGDIGLVGMAGVSALFEKDGVTHGIFRHMAAPQGPWVLKLVAFTGDFQPIQVSVRDLADEGLNLQPTGILHWNNWYLLAHSNNDTTTPATGEENREIWLRLFTDEFELIQAIKLDDLGIHPTLATDGERLYLAYSSTEKMKVAVFDRTSQ